MYFVHAQEIKIIKNTTLLFFNIYIYILFNPEYFTILELNFVTH